ncbi:GFA family protein [Chondromyces crocatus]|uniref:Aldehyde-activating protein n=1 Tax=Chondromyces crocatus TaxID=52 RepID=A0A0K1EHX4_CHOCO|nr:GFA family protein [Chondromyces crocatus]AKT40460.1 aldehyde-activating protein [Chondromyces crocatus]
METTQPAHAAPQPRTTPRTHRGSCHCGNLTFEVDLDLSEGATRCNCSICTKLASLSAIVKPDAFRLVLGKERLSIYEWGAKVSRRYFCSRCGIHAFARGHLAELGGDYVGVNLNCLDDAELSRLETTYWDGRHNNWQAGARSTPWPIHPAGV